MLGAPHHIDITVTNVAVSSEFYDAVLSLLQYCRTDQYEGGTPCWIYTGKALFSIALHEARNTSTHDRYSPGLHHLAFGAVSRGDVDRLYDELRQRNVEILDPPAEYDYTQGYYAVFFSDPDGMKLEVVYEPNAAPAAGQQ